MISDNGQNFRVMAKGAVLSQIQQKQLAAPDSPEASSYLAKFTGKKKTDATGNVKSVHAKTSSTDADASTSLVVGISMDLLGEQYVWDGVITKLSDQNNEDLGDLKLSDLNSVHVKLAILKTTDGSYYVAMMGCTFKCDEKSKQEVYQTIPVVAVDTKNNMVMIDLSAVGKHLDLAGKMVAMGSDTHETTIYTKTVAADYSLSTLVFDVESHMIPASGNLNDSTVPETVFTTRWFLRLASAFNPAFEAREPTPEVGFFLTNRSADKKIERWSTTSPDGVAVLHYYVKNVPLEYQSAFKAAFDEWNTKLKPIIGKQMFSYEFVSPDDPRSALLVTGDPRFNIVEWDLENKASYGGLGPSIANQFTGENLTANVLIQGPQIVVLYQDWFKVNAQAQALRDSGQKKAADLLLIEARHQIFDKLDDLAARPKFNLSMNGLSFRIHSQRAELADPIAQRNDFDPLPAGLNYDDYMYGYFRAMLTHELGHNLGLRHNFKGSLGSTGNGEYQVSRSIMEYLSRDFRYLDHVDDYDLMALQYGYNGTKPTHSDWFCTDQDAVENEGSYNSAECTPNDATPDPFSWYESRLAAAINDLINRGNPEGPNWTVDNMDRELGIAVNGMHYYALSAKATSSTWINFFSKPERPKDPDAIKAYVIARFKAQLCDPSLAKEASLKATPADQAKTLDNIAALRAKVVSYITGEKTNAPDKGISADDLKCVAAPVAAK
jgi:hypothetical protein